MQAGIFIFTSGIFEGQLEEQHTTQILYLLFLTIVIIGGVSWMAAIVTITKDIMENVLPQEKPNRCIQQDTMQ